jgi:hypothetical protein
MRATKVMRSPFRRYAAFALVLVLGVMSAPLSASAQEEEEGRRGTGDDANVIYRKKTVVSFDDDTIDGNLTKPDGDYVEARKRVRHSNLIRIRENFREKILESVSSL